MFAFTCDVRAVTRFISAAFSKDFPGHWCPHSRGAIECSISCLTSIIWNYMEYYVLCFGWQLYWVMFRAANRDKRQWRGRLRIVHVACGSQLILGITKFFLICLRSVMYDRLSAIFTLMSVTKMMAG